VLIAVSVGIGIPALVFAIYFWGRASYGEKWYLAFGSNAAYGADDPVEAELEELRFTRLHLNDESQSPPR
jgi:hypothetical protein